MIGIPLSSLTGEIITRAGETYKREEHVGIYESKKNFGATSPWYLPAKIENSAWRWGIKRQTWPELLAAYHGIQSFALTNDPDETINLIWSTGCNEYGYTEFETNVYLDGVFGFLVYYKGIHVLTLGFSFAGEGRLLLQQIQSPLKRGNRYLFKLSENRISFILDRFQKHFPHHAIYIVDGDSLGKRSLASYQARLEKVSEQIKVFSRDRTHYSGSIINDLTQEAELLQEKITALEGHVPRLTRFYGNTSPFKISEEIFEKFSLLHRRILFN